MSKSTNATIKKNKTRRKGWWIKQSFSNDFVHLLEDLYKKYGEEVFAVQGIANQHLDIAEFSRNFFGKSSNVASISVDGNANVKEKNIQQYNFETNKSLMKLNSLYILFKIMKNNYDLETAEQAVEDVLSGLLFINDFTNFNMPYSYYQQTPLIIRVNGGPSKMVTMKALFEEYEEFVEKLPDRETINLTKVYKKIDFNNVSVGSKRKKTAMSKNPSESVLQKHFIETLDGDGKWVHLKRVLRHRNEKDYVVYQTKGGDMAFVTSDHPVIMEDGSEKNAEELSVGEVVMGSSVVPKIRSVVDVPSDMAYLIGFLTGDGAVGHHKFHQDSKNLTGDDVAIKIDELRGNVHIYQKNIAESKIYSVIERLFPENEINIMDDRQLVFNSNCFRLLLAKFFGISAEASYTKFVPVNLLDWTEDSISAYVSGLIDSDGTVTPSGSVNLYMSAYSVINQLSDVLNAIGVHNSKSIKEVGSSKSGYDKDKLSFLFGINFQPKSVMLENSTKLSKLSDEISFDNKFDTAECSDEVLKIYKLESGTEKILLTGENVLEYVYDVTTSSGTFYSCGMTQHNCFAFDLRNLLMNGMNFFDGEIKINPPKRSDSFIALIIQSTAYISNQIMGAASYPDFFAVLDYFYRNEFGEDYTKHLNDESSKGKRISKQIQNQFQNFVYSMNFPFRGSQSAFTNLSVMDMGFLKSLFNGYVYPDGTKPNLGSVCDISKFFYEYFSEINGNEGIFTFPVMTMAISVDENNEYIDKDFVKWSAKANCEKSLANVFQSQPTSFSSCCRMVSDLETANKSGFQNSFGVGGLSVGSHRVVGLNLPRLALDSDEELDRAIEMTHKILYAHRKLIQHRIEGGFLPLYDTGWIVLSKQYSTVGIVGVYEYLKNKGLSIHNPEDIVVANEVIGKIENKIAEWQNSESGKFIVVTLDDNRKVKFKEDELITVMVVETEEVKKISAKEFSENSDKYLLGL